MTISTSKPHQTRPFTAVVIHQDQVTRWHTELLLEFLAQDALSDIDFEAAWIPLEILLNDHQTRDAASEVVQDAAFVIFSVQGRTVLPNAVKKWIESSLLARREDQGALILMGGLRKVSVNPETQKYLSQLADRAGMSFFYQSTPASADSAESTAAREGRWAS